MPPGLSSFAPTCWGFRTFNETNSALRTANDGRFGAPEYRTGVHQSTGCLASFSAGHVRDLCWSNPMQMIGQVECKRVGKSVQLPRNSILVGVTTQDTAEPSVITSQHVAMKACLTLASFAFLSFPKSLPSPKTNCEGTAYYQ